MTRRLAQRRSMQAMAAAVAAGGVMALGAVGTASAQVSLPAGYQMRVFAAGNSSMTNPDDITRLGGWFYVTYQNNAGADGTPAGSMSTIVAYRRNGSVARTWSVAGRCDGLTADPGNHRVIGTINEDANSSLFTVSPDSPTVQQYTYSPDPTSLSGGGTDAISILNGQIFISASNPSPTMAGGTTFSAPAVFTATVPVGGSTATLTPTFNDNSAAIDAVSGSPVTLNLSDPDSNATVPNASPRFGGDFMLDSQGDSELIFASNPGAPTQGLTRLTLTSASGAPQVDDVRWATKKRGTLLLSDASNNQIDAITGPLGKGTTFVDIPSDSQALAGDLGTIDLSTGAVTALGTGFGSPKGLVYVIGNLPHKGKGGSANGHGKHHHQNSQGQNGKHGKSGKSGSHGHGHSHS